MTPLRARMIEDMVSAALAPSTQEAYLQAVRGLAAYYKGSLHESTLIVRQLKKITNYQTDSPV